jgi:hypothetical protein
VNHQFRALQVLHEVIDDIGKTGFILQKFVGYAVHFDGTGINETVGLQILVKIVTGKTPLNKFDTTNLDDAVVLLPLQARGFRIQYYLPHYLIS